MTPYIPLTLTCASCTSLSKRSASSRTTGAVTGTAARYALDVRSLTADLGTQVFGVQRVWPARTYEEKLGEPFTVPPELRDIALRCGEVFGIDLYGLDIIESLGRPYVVDVSSFPGFKGVPDAALRLADYIFWAAEHAAGEQQSPRRKVGT